MSFKASTENWTDRYKGHRKDVEGNKSTIKNVHNTCIDLQGTATIESILLERVYHSQINFMAPSSKKLT